MKKIIFLSLGLVFVSPLIASAQTFFGIAEVIGDFLGYIIPILITLAVVYFIWGVIQYLIAGDEEKKKKATGMITAGLIGLFIIVAFWGIIRLVSNTFNVGPEQLNRQAIPCVPQMDINGDYKGNCN